MTSIGMLSAARGRDWSALPWPLMGAGLAMCLTALGLTWALHTEPAVPRILLLTVGLLCAGAAVAMRLTGTGPVAIDRILGPSRTVLLYGLSGLFVLLAVAGVAIFVTTFYELPWFPWRTGEATYLCIVVIPLGLGAGWRAWQLARQARAFSPAEESALLLLLGSLCCFLSCWALYLPDDPHSWDTIRLLLGVFTGVSLIGAPMVLASMVVRRWTISVLVLLHFSAIGIATLSAPPTPWPVIQLWVRIYRPYLEFMYLNNAYHFYAPEPGPASYLWCRLIYEKNRDQQGDWYKIPTLDERTGQQKHLVALEYQRYLSLMTNIEATEPVSFINNVTGQYQPFYDVRQRCTLAVPVLGYENPKLVVPYHPLLQISQQYSRPNDTARRLLRSYVRHVADFKAHHPDPKLEGYELKWIKVYRVRHDIVPSDAYSKLDPPLSPNDPITYRPFYMGRYDTEGNLTDAPVYNELGSQVLGDPYLYWMLPILRVDRTGLIKDYARLHAGDPHWLRLPDTEEWVGENRARELLQRENQADQKKLQAQQTATARTRRGRRARCRRRCRGRPGRSPNCRTTSMKKPTEIFALPRWMQSWERFWFTPMDPTPLALIRILCGSIVLYTFFIYSFCLSDMMGKNAWVDLPLRQEMTYDRAIMAPNLHGARPPAPAKTPEQQRYLEEYHRLFGADLRMLGLPPPDNQQQWNYLVAYTEHWHQPPPAYAEGDKEAKTVDDFIEQFNVDPRMAGLRMPKTAWEHEYLQNYIRRWHIPPPEYAADQTEADEIDTYRRREGVDPRLVYARGMPIFTIWMHVTDPRWMAWVQGACVLSALLMVLGLGTRVTTALTWLAQLCYLHRNAQVMFGADTMINILLLYLTIGPSGAALSLDRLLARWWRGERSDSPPAPRVSANIAIRLLQIHVCIIYFVAGLAKLQGTAWWNGTAIWSVIANFEFAPMHIPIYNDVLRFLCRDELVLQAIATFSCYFTLAFEIGYLFLIWWPRTRWLYLAAAIILHGVIGIVMGLKTFSMIMLVMNMAFLRPEEVHWMLGWFRSSATPQAPATATPAPAPVLEAAGAFKVME